MLQVGTQAAYVLKITMWSYDTIYIEENAIYIQ